MPDSSLANGYHDLPRGKPINLTNALEIFGRPKDAGRVLLQGFSLRRMWASAFGLNRTLAEGFKLF